MRQRFTFRKRYSAVELRCLSASKAALRASVQSGPAGRRAGGLYR